VAPGVGLYHKKKSSIGCRCNSVARCLSACTQGPGFHPLHHKRKKERTWVNWSNQIMSYTTKKTNKEKVPALSTIWKEEKFKMKTQFIICSLPVPTLTAKQNHLPVPLPRVSILLWTPGLGGLEWPDLEPLLHSGSPFSHQVCASSPTAAKFTWMLPLHPSCWSPTETSITHAPFFTLSHLISCHINLFEAPLSCFLFTAQNTF
jgi:hypothetical protein